MIRLVGIEVVMVECYRIPVRLCPVHSRTGPDIIISYNTHIKRVSCPTVQWCKQVILAVYVSVMVSICVKQETYVASFYQVLLLSTYFYFFLITTATFYLLLLLSTHFATFQSCFLPTIAFFYSLLLFSTLSCYFLHGTATVFFYTFLLIFTYY